MAGSLFSNAVITFFVNTKQATGAIADLEKSFSGSMGNMVAAVGGLIGAKGLKGYYDQLQQIVQLTEKWNLPIEDFSEFLNLFSQFGGKAEEAMAIVNNLQDMQTSLALESDERLQKLSAKLGTQLNNKDYKEVIESLREVYTLLSNDPNRNAQEYVAKMIGDYPALLRMLRASNEEYDKATEKAKEMRHITQEQAEELTEVDKKLGKIRQQWANIGYTASQAFTPFVDYLESFTDWVEGLSDNAIQDITLAGTALSTWGTWKVTKGLLAKLFGGGAASAGATAAGTTATGAGATATAAGASLLGMGLTALAGILWPTSIAMDENPDGTPMMPVQVGSSLSGDLANYDAAENEINAHLHEMRQLASKQLQNEKNNANRVPTTDNRSVTINIYGVDGAEDMMTQLRGLPMNNMSPISWKQ